MTPSEAKIATSPIIISKKPGNEGMSRRASFKCPVPNKSASHKIDKKVFLPMSTVQALAFKFDELSQMNQNQIHKISQTTVKNVKTVNGKPNTIKVVICRKPSTTKHKRPEDVILRRKVNVRKFQSAESEVTKENNITHKNVHQRISEYEDKAEMDSKLVLNSVKTRSAKMQVPKILVDIDLGAENCMVKHKNDVETDGNSQKNSFSVRNAINLFEKNSVENSTSQTIPKRSKTINESKNSNTNYDSKTKPIAAIRPILKKSEDKIIRKIKVSPKDSLNRKKYIAMRRESMKDGKESSDEDSKSKLGKQNGVDKLKSNKTNGVEVFNPQKQNVASESKQTNGETDKRFINNSSLHRQIVQSSFTVITNEISLNDDKSPENTVDTVTGNGNQNLKPNASFLWSKKEEIYAEQKRSINRMDLPLPVPPENFVPEIEETLYDDVGQIREDSESEDFEKISESEEETYDDVGVYWKNNKEKDYDTEEVREKNKLNELSNAKAEPIQDNGGNYLYSYDDGEGERYQYISDKSNTTQSKQSECDLYQYIQDEKDGNNIYEDIQSIKTTKDKGQDIYEDINSIKNSVTDNGLISNCYESVYNGIYSNNNGNQAYIKSDISDTSNNSGKSTYEKSNSLYGMSTGNVNENGTEHGLSLSDVNESLENSGYHLTLHGSACPNSETSQSNSDDWIEVSESEYEETVFLVHERPRKARTGGVNQKERRRWKSLQRKSYFHSEEAKLQNSEDHLYESVGQYENAEIIQEENLKTVQPGQPHNITGEPVYNDEQYIDDFDSQSSEDEAFVDAKLPDTPNHGYNITKSLKAAGKKLRKNLSLRKSDFSKSLKRFKKSSRLKVNEIVFAEKKEVEDSSPKAESPSTPTNLNNSIYSNTSDSSSSSHNFTKSNSSGDLKRHRKSWTFRNKFKSNSTDASDTQSVDSSNRNSTFYLPLSEIQGNKKLEKKDDLLNEIQTVLSQRNSNSYENLDAEVVLKHSDGGLALSKNRPNVPPPPPPTSVKVEITGDKTRYSDIIWAEKATNNSLYVESGLFDKQKKHSRCLESDSSLYAEVGLYAANEDEYSCNKKSPMFVDEPLYQFYTECVNQRARDDILNNYDSEGYEEINDYYSVINEKRRTIDIKNVRPNFEDFNDNVRPKAALFRSVSDRRTLWCQIPAVIDSCILETLSDQARKLQEAKFEILTSEGSYMNSLNVLENHFMKKVNDLNLISKRDFRILFGNIVSVKKCSENFLEDLENCWQNNIMLNGICDIVYKHSKTSFQVYTKYCKNQVCIYRTLRELLDKNSNFEAALKEIESDSVCQNLNIHSFLMLPMQRITRLPLLMGAVLARLDKTDDEYEVCKTTFDILNKIVQDCDDEARRMEKCEEMLILSQQIEFPKDIRRIPIITGSRFLVKSGPATQLVNRDENKLTFGKKFSKVSLTMFLFTDLLILAKKKNIRNYVVVDHCPRNLVQMQTTDGLSQLPVKLNTNSDMGGKFLMLLTMLENHEKKTVEMILSFEMESDRQRWLDAVTPKLSENPNESIYEEWDCPQVIALYEFTPAQPDELSLCIGDVVNVLKKMNDGWYQGERLRDGARGWFPQNHTQEISSSHVRAKNKKLRYKLLALSGNLIDSQKMNGK